MDQLFPEEDEFRTATAASPIIAYGFSDKILLGVSLIGLCVLAWTIYSILILRLKSMKELEQNELATAANYEEQLLHHIDVATLNRAQRRARARAIMKQSRRIAMNPPNAAVAEQDNDDDDNNQQIQLFDNDNDDHNNFEHDEDQPNSHLSRKERQQVAKLLEKKERQLYEEERRKFHEEEMQQIQKEKEERRKYKVQQKELQRQQEQQRLIEEQQDENEQFLTFISSSSYTISVMDWIEQLQQDRIYNVTDVVHYINDDCVTMDLIWERIEQLLAEGRVSGIIEKQQGIFIYVTDLELHLLSKRIMMNGCSTMSDIASFCNEILFQ